MPVKIIIIDDDFSERTRLIKLLSYCDSIKYKLYESEPHDALKLIEDVRPDIIFIEVIMNNYSGFDIINSLFKNGSRTSIVYLHKSDKYAIKSIRTFAFDYLLKPVSIDELKECLKRFVNDNYSIDNGDVLDTSNLSLREIEVLKQLVKGMRSKEIAQKLNISINTVNSHRSNLLKKCHVKNVAELMNKSKNLLI